MNGCQGMQTVSKVDDIHQKNTFTSQATFNQLEEFPGHQMNRDSDIAEGIADDHVKFLILHGLQRASGIGVQNRDLLRVQPEFFHSSAGNLRINFRHRNRP